MSDEIKQWSADRIERGLALTKYDFFWLDPFVHVRIDTDALIEEKLQEKTMSKYDLSDRELQDEFDGSGIEYHVLVENVGEVNFTESYDEALEAYRDYIDYAKVTPTTNQVSLWSSSSPDPLQEFECLSAEPAYDLEDFGVGTGVTRTTIADRRFKNIEQPVVEKLPYTIIEVVNSRKIKVRADNYHCYNEHLQYYKFTANPEGVIHTLSLRNNGVWRIVGHHTNTYFTIGMRMRFESGKK